MSTEHDWGFFFFFSFAFAIDKRNFHHRKFNIPVVQDMDPNIFVCVCYPFRTPCAFNFMRIMQNFHFWPVTVGDFAATLQGGRATD